MLNEAPMNYSAIIILIIFSPAAGFWPRIPQYTWTSIWTLWKELDTALTSMNITPPEISGSYVHIWGQSSDHKV